MIILLIVVLWIISGLLSAHLHIKDLQRIGPTDRGDILVGGVMSLCGPFSLFVAVIIMCCNKISSIEFKTIDKIVNYYNKIDDEV